MKFYIYILSFWLIILSPISPACAQTGKQAIHFDFYGESIDFKAATLASVPFNDSLSAESLNNFYNQIIETDYQDAVNTLITYKNAHQPDDWVYYQLIRKTAENISPKAENYYRYTMYKWFLLCKSGYNATLNITNNKLLFYVQSDEEIYDIPLFTNNGKQYICLNYHDYGYYIDFDKKDAHNIPIPIEGAVNKFSYRLTHLPNFKPDNYKVKDFAFNYQDVNYHFKIKISDEVKKMFVNYPVADYQLYFNAPLSNETYNSIIPQLRKTLKGMNIKHGVDYLMHFTRYTLAYQTDSENFGRERRLSPEQTLLYDRSDCEDRAALFYYLVKEIYNLPMIVLAFPHHLTIAVKFDRPVGKEIIYNGTAYSVCEPTPQAEDLSLGELAPELRTEPYQVAYAYDPGNK